MDERPRRSRAGLFGAIAGLCAVAGALRLARPSAVPSRFQVAPADWDGSLSSCEEESDCAFGYK